MNLFDLDESGIVVIDPIAYTLIPFKEIWQRDKSKDKDTARKELAYIYFNNDYKSDFFNEPNEDKRKKEIIRCVFGPGSDWVPDEKVQKAEEFYKEREETVSSKLLEGALIYANKVDDFFRSVNLKERNDKGSYVFNPKIGSDILKDLGKTVESIKELQEAVRKEKDAKTKLRADREKPMYADGD